MNGNDVFVSWLSDAHSTEVCLISALEEHIGDAGRFPDLQAGLRMHLDQTRRHAQLMEGCLTRQGGSPSTIKSSMAKVAGAAKSTT